MQSFMLNFYTPKQANSILPQIKLKFINLLEIRKKIIKVQNELNDIVKEDSSMEIFFNKKNELNHLVASLYKEIENIESNGILIKSFDEGLLDFPSLRFEKEVWLCWKYGEDKIKFWHHKNEGFLGRKPLSIKGTYNEDNPEDLR